MKQRDTFWEWCKDTFCHWFYSKPFIGGSAEESLTKVGEPISPSYELEENSDLSNIPEAYRQYEKTTRWLVLYGNTEDK